MSLRPLFVFHCPSLLLYPPSPLVSVFNSSILKCKMPNVLKCCLSSSLVKPQQRDGGDSSLAGGLITCFALDALNWFPLTPAISGQIAERTSSSVKTLLVESQITHYRAITSVSYKRSLYCVRVNSQSFVPALLKMLPFSCGAPSLFSGPRCLIKINYSFPFTLFNCLAMRLDLSQIRGSNIEIFVITGFLLCQKEKINQR